jgi:ABC-type multidrug transport system fused ATPase/permease subunit
MGFIMDGLDAEDYDRTYNDRDLLRRILSYFRPKLGAMLLVATMIVLLSMSQAAVPLLVSEAVDAIEAGTITDVGWQLAAGLLLVGGLGWLFNFVRQSNSSRVTGDVVLRLREDAFDAVLARDLSFYDETPSGRIVSRVTSDTDDFATVSTLTMDLISQVLMVGFVTVLLFLRSVELALLTLLVVPVVMGLALLFRRLARSSTRKAQRSLGRVNANLQETMGGIAVAKNFRQEQQVYDEFRPINQQSYQVTLRQGYVFSGIFPVLFLVAGLATVALVQLGGTTVLGGGLSAGDWYLFLQGVALFWFPLTSIAAFWSQFQQGLSASERVFALIDAPPRVVQTAAEPVGRLAGRIEFANVTFGYDSAHPVLRNFGLLIEAGETVALVGHTGAGKSTLSKLITRFYEFQDGRTSIVIAHRLSTIEHVDRIIVLDHGRIVEEGDHATLLAKGGRYCQVYNTYFRHQSPHYRPGSGFVAVTD